jgi:hypothetical protein
MKNGIARTDLSIRYCQTVMILLDADENQRYWIYWRSIKSKPKYYCKTAMRKSVYWPFRYKIRKNSLWLVPFATLFALRITTPSDDHVGSPTPRPTVGHLGFMVTYTYQSDSESVHVDLGLDMFPTVSQVQRPVNYGPRTESGCPLVIFGQ